uniref:Uncharacterized protein n=1 Tax=Siphoviridae sp. ctB3v5 TaxID=2826186 RepID=A0A8S5M9F5_9CAUD|nr:MAG TPA: hypothetical protein [Siphoviridae sp. ctB3v5]
MLLNIINLSLYWTSQSNICALPHPIFIIPLDLIRTSTNISSKIS